MEELSIKLMSIGALVISIFIISFLISFITKSTSFYSNLFKKYGIQFIFVFSLVATLGSLGLSFLFEMPPCDLCWYQRMFMYPIVFISGFAWYKKDFRNGAIYSMMMAIIGALIAMYHYLIQISDSLKSSAAFCSPTSVVDCSIPDFIEFGFVTTPYISLVFFVTIMIASFYVSRKQ